MNKLLILITTSLLLTLNFNPTIDNLDYEEIEMDYLIDHNGLENYSGDVDCSELNECDLKTTL